MDYVLNVDVLLLFVHNCDADATHERFVYAHICVWFVVAVCAPVLLQSYQF